MATDLAMESTDPSKKTKETQKSANIKKASENSFDAQDRKTLANYENRIRSGIIKYYETGYLLQEIRDKKLYQLRKYKTFQEYCEKTFQFGRAYGYRLIAYCKIWNLIKGKDEDKIPERVIRALYKIKDDAKLKECWDKAKEKNHGAVPQYKEIEAAVTATQRSLLMQSKQFDPDTNKDRIFLNCLGESVRKDHAADDLINASGSKFHKLYNAIKEAQRLDVVFSQEEQQKLKDALLQTIDSLDSLFSGKEE